MKKIYILIAFISFHFVDITAQTTITEWDFDDETITPAIGVGTISNIGGITETYAAGFPSTGRGYNTSTYPAQSTASGTAGIEIAVSTVGENNIGISFDHRGSGTSSRWAQYEYSTDGGANWVIAGNNNGGLSPHDTFALYQVDLTACTSCNNNPDFKFRIVSIFSPIAFDTQGSSEVFGPNAAYHRSRVDGTNTSAYSTGGTWRFDNIKVIGGFVLSNPTFENQNVIEMAPNPAKDVVVFSKKVSVTIYDISGKFILQATDTESIDVSSLSQGLYLVKNNDGFAKKLIIQ